jgi:hypothetical protein
VAKSPLSPPLPLFPKQMPQAPRTRGSEPPELVKGLLNELRTAAKRKGKDDPVRLRLAIVEDLVTKLDTGAGDGPMPGEGALPVLQVRGGAPILLCSVGDSRVGRSSLEASTRTMRVLLVDFQVDGLRPIDVCNHHFSGNEEKLRRTVILSR